MIRGNRLIKMRSAWNSVDPYGEHRHTQKGESYVEVKAETRTILPRSTTGWGRKKKSWKPRESPGTSPSQHSQKCGPTHNFISDLLQSYSGLLLVLNYLAHGTGYSSSRQLHQPHHSLVLGSWMVTCPAWAQIHLYFHLLL